MEGFSTPPIWKGICDSFVESIKCICLKIKSISYYKLEKQKTIEEWFIIIYKAI